MLTDFLRGELWQTVTEGVKMCKLPADHLRKGLYRAASSQSSEASLELFFCCSGSLLIERSESASIRIGEQEIFLYSSVSDIRAIRIDDPPVGYCISIKSSAFRLAFQKVFDVLGHPDIFDGRIEKMFEHHRGCMRIHNTSWNESVFSVMRSLPYREQGRYCVLRIAELLFLLFEHHKLLDIVQQDDASALYPSQLMRSVRDYMDNHLDEKMTIDSLSKKFHLSPTALKNGFHAIYGLPVHTWLLNRRIQKGADLLQFSEMTVLQIAQSVGYEGVGQFNMVFKRHYALTPTQYRKMSNSSSF